MHHVHDPKLDALRISWRANGSPVLVFSPYRHDIARIEERFKGHRCADTTERDITDWNDGKIDIALTHPAGAVTGLTFSSGVTSSSWFRAHVVAGAVPAGERKTSQAGSDLPP